MHSNRLLIAILLMAVCIILTDSILSASRMEQKEAAIKTGRAAKYLIPPRLLQEGSKTVPGFNPPQINLRAPATNSPGTVIGHTHVDYQSDHSRGRRIALGNPPTDYTHMVWLYQPNPLYWDLEMGIKYQVYSDGEYEYTAGGLVISGMDYSCESSLATLGDNRAVFGNDHSKYLYHSVANIEFQPDMGVFIVHYLSPDSTSDWYEEGMRSVYPAVETHFGSDTVIYVLNKAMTAELENIGLVLYRKVGNADFEPGQLIEARYGWPHTIVARQYTDSVAIVYIDYNSIGGGEYSGRLSAVYRLSTDQGLTWGPPINAAQYTLDTMWTADTDISALWDDNGALHMVWHSRERIDYDWTWIYRCRLHHWSTADERTTIIAEARYDAECSSNRWDMNAGHISLSLCEGKFYVLWTQYNDYDISDDCSEAGFANGELYMSASDDNGLTWDTIVNLTNTRTPGCAAGDCESDVYPSMTRYGAEYDGARDSLDLIYINDKDAGCIVYGDGTWTVNNVMHYRIPCREVVHLPRITVAPQEYGYPIMLEPDQTRDTSLTITNIGNNLLNWEASIIYITGGEYNWLGVTPSSGTIDISPSNTGTATLTFDSNDLPGGPSRWDAELVISAADYPGVVDPITIPITLIVATPDIQPKADTIDNGCRSLIFYNTGQIGGGNPGYSLNIPGDCDTLDTYPQSDMYLYDASPVISYVNDASDTVAYTTIFQQAFMDPETFRPQGGFIKNSETDFDIVKYRAMTVDSIFGIDVTFIIPTDGSCFIFGKNDYYLLEGVTEKTGVCLGLISDWDIPSDSLADNGSNYNETLNTIWQNGAEYQDDNAGVCALDEYDRLGGIAVFSNPPKNAWTEDNQAHQEPPAYDQKFIYSQMSSLNGYNPYTPGYGQDPFIDLHTGITFTQTDMNPGDTFTYFYSLITTNQGEADYLTQAAAARVWVIEHILPPDCKPGDANNDNQINVGDAVYLISYIFKGGPPPTPYKTCSGDANGDCQCNVGDAVYIISYIFKGGPAPIDFYEWFTTCGSPVK